MFFLITQRLHIYLLTESHGLEELVLGAQDNLMTELVSIIHVIVTLKEDIACNGPSSKIYESALR